jgi:hypothetical protein
MAMAAAQKDRLPNVGCLEGAKAWYVPLFLLRLIVVAAILIGTTFFSPEYLLYPLTTLAVLYSILIVVLHPYHSIFHNIGVCISESVALFSVLLAVVTRQVSLD